MSNERKHRADDGEVLIHDDALLDTLLADVRAEPGPTVSAEVEKRLAEKIAEQSQSSADQRDPAQPNSLARVFAFAAAAAVFGLLVTSVATSGSDPIALNAEKDPGIVEAAVNLDAAERIEHHTDSLPLYDGRALKAGSRVQGKDIPVQVAVPGLARWTVAPNSEVISKRLGGPRGPLVLELTRGSVVAEVTPQESGQRMLETVIVECEGTRIAVHGTVFSVERHGHEVVVEVTHGSVSVAPRTDRGMPAGRILVGPHRAAFNARTGKWLRSLPMTEHGLATTTEHPPTPKIDGAAPAKEPAPESPSAETPAPTRPSKTAPAAPEVPAPSADVAPGPKTLDRAATSAAIRQCVTANVGLSAGAATATLRTRVTLRTAKGIVETVVFNPPLKPAVQQRCAAPYFGAHLDGGDLATDVVVTSAEK